jgi:hypothetical protein
MRADGDRIYYLGSTFLPDAGRCLCLYEAKTPDIVADLNRQAHLPADRIIPAMTLATLADMPG